jgi:predicted outer membrane repeat protein
MIFTLAGAVVFCSLLPARTITVTSTGSNGAGSLGEAIVEANRDMASDTILFQGIDTLVLTEELPAITDAVVIDGGQDGVVIKAGADVNAENLRGIFTLHKREGSVHGPFESVFTRLTLVGGYAERGGAICNLLVVGKMTVTDCTFTNNRAKTYGGALWSGCLAEICHCVFESNESDRGGSAVCFNYDELYPTFTSTVAHSVFNTNRTPGYGAIVAYGKRIDSFIVDNCIFSENEAGSGGAIANERMEVFNSLFINNRSLYDGGAINCSAGDYGGSTTIVNSTFLGNRAKNGGAVAGGSFHGIDGSGGDLWDFYLRSHPRIVHCTFAGNEAAGKGGALYSIDISILNTILLGNRAGETEWESGNVFLGSAAMAFSIHDGGIRIGENFNNSSIGNRTATVREVFGTNTPQVNEHGVIEITKDGPAGRNGRLAGIIESRDLYYRETGEWKPVWGNSASPDEEITPVVTDQLGNGRTENYISIGAWQYPHDISDAVHPVRTGEIEITAHSRTLSVKTGYPVSLEVYTVSGLTVVRKNIPEGVTTVSLPAGIYVVKAGDTVRKVALKN